MSNHEITFARDMMEWRLLVDEEKKNSRDLDTYSHLASVTRLQSALHRENGDSGAAALATAERSIELVQTMSEMEPSRKQWQVMQVACWLDKLDAELMDGQNMTLGVRFATPGIVRSTRSRRG